MHIPVVIFSIIYIAGCGGPPRMRVGAFFGSPGGTYYPDPENLGPHGYDRPQGEYNGLLYTCRGGFIDVGHMREAADRTRYLAMMANRKLSSGRSEFHFRIIEPSQYKVTITYPAGWENMPKEERDSRIDEVSILLGQYLAHKTMIWHEIITWYGFSSTGVLSERISSFSFEDTYSDATGIFLGGQALRREGSYDKIMTELIDRWMRELQAQPPVVAQRAVEEIRGKWYTGEMYVFTKMTNPNLDIGLEGGCITPKLVHGICPDITPMPCIVPDLDAVSDMGFKVSIELDPRIWQKEAICRSIGLDSQITKLDPIEHFPMILQYISQHR